MVLWYRVSLKPRYQFRQIAARAQAIEIVQRNERGRQGKQRALLLKDLREEEKRRRIYDATDQLEMDPEIAAANIQVYIYMFLQFFP